MLLGGFNRGIGNTNISGNGATVGAALGGRENGGIIANMRCHRLGVYRIFRK